jgi:hypothetical protein
MAHRVQRKPTPPSFVIRVDNGCGCPLGFILAMGFVLLCARHYGWPGWLILLLWIPAGALIGAIVSLVFEGIEYGVGRVVYRIKLSAFQRSYGKRRNG